MIWEPQLSELDIATIRERDTQKRALTSIVWKTLYAFGIIFLVLTFVSHP